MSPQVLINIYGPVLSHHDSWPRYHPTSSRNMGTRRPTEVGLYNSNPCILDRSLGATRRAGTLHLNVFPAD